MPGQIIPLTDEEIVAVASDPQMVAKFTSDERRRMVRLVPAKETISAHGYFEPLPGAQGMRWHPPEGAGDELHRPDNSLLGLPPELAVTSGLGVGRAMAGATGMLGRAAAGAKAVASNAAPGIKYEVTKTGLEWMGMSPGPASVIALGVSGASMKGARRAPRSAKRTMSSAAVEPTPPPPTAAAAPSVPASAPASSAGSGWSPQRIRNEVGLAARRSGQRLNAAQMEQADALVSKGMAPAEAVQRASGAAPARARLSAAETGEYTRLRRAGKSHEDAMASIAQQRDLAGQLGTPSSESVRQAVSERNRTGRWQ